MTCPALIPAKSRPPLTALGVHRVALIGDSIMNQASCSGADSLANLGIQTGRYAVPGSGLLTGSVNWLSQTQQILRFEHPDLWSPSLFATIRDRRSRPPLASP